ncbi:MAG: hypothetical protein GX344_04535 [Intrasporangiaceae bacterium]|nr:hypothetical protein [Intrasporangiaceae bacterium]
MSSAQQADGAWHASAWSGLVLALALGAATYAAWLGWDNEYYYDAAVGAYQGPYRPMQVAGCALTFGVVNALLAMRWRPLIIAVGTTVGFWILWTLQAGSQDETGLFVVGSALLLVGLALGSALTAWIGSRLRRRRTG